MPAPEAIRQQLEERDWPRRIRAGDHAAYRSMFDRYHAALCRYAFSYLRNEDAAKDVVQGLFVRIWETHESWHVDGPVHAYLFGAVRRRAISVLRGEGVVRKHRDRLIELVPGSGDAGRSARADSRLEAEELEAQVARAIASLPPRTREAFELSRSRGLSYEEIGRAMGISPNTVGVHINRSLATIRKAVGPYLAALTALLP